MTWDDADSQVGWTTLAFRCDGGGSAGAEFGWFANLVWVWRQRPKFWGRCEVHGNVGTLAMWYVYDAGEDLGSESVGDGAAPSMYLTDYVTGNSCQSTRVVLDGNCNRGPAPSSADLELCLSTITTDTVAVGTSGCP